MWYTKSIISYRIRKGKIMKNILRRTEQKSRKRGFTILELIIVIAVIAILAAVAIPTFAGVVRKARISAKTQMAKSINTILTVEEITDGRPKSMYDAIKVMSENGFDIGELSSDDDLLLAWVQSDNRIAVVDDELNSVYTHNGAALPDDKVLIWQVVNEIPSESATSIYLADGFAEENISVSVGVDVGDNLDIKSIVYTDDDAETKSILLRANGNATVTDISNNSDDISLLGESQSASLHSSEINETNRLSIYESLTEFSLYNGNAVIRSGASVETVRLLSERQESISMTVEDGNMVIVGEDFTLIIESGAHVGNIVDPDGNKFVFSGDDGNGGNTEGGDTTEPDDTKPDEPKPEPEPDPELTDQYYGFKIFDTNKLKDHESAEAYLVGYSDNDDLNYMDLLKAIKYAEASVDGFAYIILLCDLPEVDGGGKNQTLYIDKNIIIDLNGHTLSNTGNDQDKIIIEDGGHLKLIDTSDSKNGAVTAVLDKGTEYRPSAISMNEGASLTVYDGNISGVTAAIYVRGSATITIKRGRFENVGSSAPIVVKTEATITIDAGTFVAGEAGKPMIVFGTSGNSSTITINDCNYDGNLVGSNFKGQLIDNRENK